MTTMTMKTEDSLVTAWRELVRLAPLARWSHRRDGLHSWRQAPAWEPAYDARDVPDYVIDADGREVQNPVVREASDRFSAAEPAFCEAMEAASDGVRPSGYRVVHHHALGGDESYVTLVAPGGLVLAMVQSHRRGWSALRVLRTMAQARVVREAERVQRREAHALYLARLDAAAQAVRVGRRVEYRDGQCGGAVRLPEWPAGVEVSSRAVARRAGVEETCA